MPTTSTTMTPTTAAPTTSTTTTAAPTTSTTTTAAPTTSTTTLPPVTTTPNPCDDIGSIESQLVSAKMDKAEAELAVNDLGSKAKELGFLKDVALLYNSVKDEPAKTTYINLLETKQNLAWSEFTTKTFLFFGRKLVNADEINQFINPDLSTYVPFPANVINELEIYQLKNFYYQNEIFALNNPDNPKLIFPILTYNTNTNKYEVKNEFKSLNQFLNYYNANSALIDDQIAATNIDLQNAQNDYNSNSQLVEDLEKTLKDCNSFTNNKGCEESSDPRIAICCFFNTYTRNSFQTWNPDNV